MNAVGLRFRRSMKLGPFRLNLGKSGVGVSVGNKFSRVSLGADGRVRQSFSLPGTGLSYQETSSRAPQRGAMQASDQGGRVPTGCVTGVVVFFAIFTLVMIGASIDAKLGVTVLVLSVPAGIAFAIWRARRRAAEARASEAYAVDYAARRRMELAERFGQENVPRILEGRPWQGATTAMVTEMLGPPVKVDTKVMKTKTNATWKYQPQGANRFGLKVMFEDDVCVGWEEK